MYLFGLLAICSCQDMFEPADENTRPIEAMYEESDYAHGLLIYAYDRLPYARTTQTDVATDDATTNVKTNIYRNLTTGSWASDNDPMTRWVACKDGIQYANLFLTVVDKVNWAKRSVSKQQMFIDRLKGEAYGLRALLYYYLLQAHGGYADNGVLYGVPLLTEPEDAGSDFNQPRETFAKCVQQCIQDCDMAISLLPYDFADIKSENEIPAKYRTEELQADVSGYNLVNGTKSRGRLCGKVAEAIKAQVALLAASPAFRAQSGITSDVAATYCAAVLQHIKGTDGLDPKGHVWYNEDTGLTIPEIMWRGDRQKSADEEKANRPPSLDCNGQVNPSQNLVDAFPMLNGYPISDSRSNYNPQDPYTNRDPRLDLYIIHHGSTFMGKEIMTAVNVPNDKGLTLDNLFSTDERSTITGYYMSKLLRDDVAIDKDKTTPSFHVYPRIRYTELFLDFAEAANDAWGPDDDPKGFGFTAYSIIKAIRERAGVAKDPITGTFNDLYLEECKADKAKMTQLIRNERRIELCFENMRFWDLRRWQMPLNEPIMGMRIELDPNKTDGTLIYTPFQVETRDFDSSYQWYGPIPMGEVLKWSNLKQNRGWM